MRNFISHQNSLDARNFPDINRHKHLNIISGQYIDEIPQPVNETEINTQFLECRLYRFFEVKLKPAQTQLMWFLTPFKAKIMLP